MLNKLLNRLSSLVNRGVFISDNKNRTKNQVISINGVNGQDKDVELFEIYGITSRLLPRQSEILRFCLEGYEDHSIALGGSGGKFRPKDLDEGEVCFYTNLDGSDPSGLPTEAKQRIHLLKKDRGIKIESGTNSLLLSEKELKITIGSNTLTMTSSDLTVLSDLIANNISVSKHKHPETGSITGKPK